ncbi:MAG: ATP-binding protein [Gammaproteobacteria bacterium]|nr:ATP-binding protein [Gammaproteobacteria bacterium]
MVATAEMISEELPETAHGRDGAVEANALGAREPAAALHGRLLNVSRMATIGEMAAGVAHELNQPLTAIANYAHACERLLARPESDSADVREALRQITAQTTRAADILRRLRGLARNQRVEHAPASLNDLVQELHELMQTDAIAHGVQLTLDLAPQLPDVRVDPGQIQQALLNLVRNSLDALAIRPSASASAHITIRTALGSPGEVQLSVIDDGPGLSAQALKRIFAPFFSTKENGTGLGLAITHSIVRAHGGSVAYRPNVPNGACFDILLPTQPR